MNNLFGLIRFVFVPIILLSMLFCKKAQVGVDEIIAESDKLFNSGKKQETIDLLKKAEEDCEKEFSSQKCNSGSYSTLFNWRISRLKDMNGEGAVKKILDDAMGNSTVLIPLERSIEKDSLFRLNSILKIEMDLVVAKLRKKASLSTNSCFNIKKLPKDMEEAAKDKGGGRISQGLMKAIQTNLLKKISEEAKSFYSENCNELP